MREYLLYEDNECMGEYEEKRQALKIIYRRLKINKLAKVWSVFKLKGPKGIDYYSEDDLDILEFELHSLRTRTI